jgi:hypothetical protein
VSAGSSLYTPTSTVNPVLMAGQQYWIVLPHTPPAIEIIWDFNSIGVEGGYLHGDSGWYPNGPAEWRSPPWITSATPAFAVYGTPSTWRRAQAICSSENFERFIGHSFSLAGSRKRHLTLVWACRRFRGKRRWELWPRGQKAYGEDYGAAIPAPQQGYPLRAAATDPPPRSIAHQMLWNRLDPSRHTSGSPTNGMPSPRLPYIAFSFLEAFRRQRLRRLAFFGVQRHRPSRS